MLITILTLAEAFDNLSLGKLLSLSRSVKMKDEEISRTKQENINLRENLIKLSATISQLQTLNQSTTNNNVLFTPDTFKMMLGVEKAKEKENDQEDEGIEDKKVEYLGNDSKTVSTQETEQPEKTIDWRLLEDIAFNKYIEKHNIPSVELVREVQFSSTFANIDPIMERKIIFDGYYKSQNFENFIEVKRGISPIFWDRLYVQLAKIMFYSQAKKIDAFLTLLIIDLPENLDNSYRRYSYRNMKQRVFEIFQPAIANNLLRIEFISITEDDIEIESSKEVAVSKSHE